MASPALLSERTLLAIESDDVAAFSRWTKHPRWRRSTDSDSEWALASLRAPNSVDWMERVAGLGINPIAGFRQPLLCEAARTNNVPAMRWLLDKGADVDVRSDFGLGITPGQYALNAMATDAMELLWDRTGRVWSLLDSYSSSQFAVWLRPESLPMLEHMARCGWSPDHPEVSPFHPGGQSFRQRLAEHREPASPALCAWLESVRLDGSLARPVDTPGADQTRPRSRM